MIGRLNRTAKMKAYHERHIIRLGARSRALFAGIALAGTIQTASAVVSLALHDEFSGGTQPLGSLLVQFTDIDATTVELRVTSTLVGTEFLDALYLNLNPLYDPSSIVFSAPIRNGVFGADPAISLATNGFQADGDGKYDIRLDFDNAPPGDRFDQLDIVTYSISRPAGLSESDFKFLSLPAGGHGPFFAAAHIQAIGPNDGSGWIAPGNSVPDGGATLMMLGAAISGMGLVRRFIGA